jgi:RimJ/RimL family protein N-acetyltransferase
MNLQNDSVLIEPLSLAIHGEAFNQYALSEPNTWQYSLQSPGGSIVAMQQYIDFALHEKYLNISFPFAIINKLNGDIAGSSRFYDISFTHKVATIGYTWYGEKYRKTGLNRNVKLLMLDFAFDIWQMERIEFRADINNHASIAAMKAIGCVEEGVIRSHAKVTETTRRTSMMLSILKEEWYNKTRNLLLQKIR